MHFYIRNLLYCYSSLFRTIFFAWLSAVSDIILCLTQRCPGHYSLLDSALSRTLFFAWLSAVPDLFVAWLSTVPDIILCFTQRCPGHYSLIDSALSRTFFFALFPGANLNREFERTSRKEQQCVIGTKKKKCNNHLAVSVSDFLKYLRVWTFETLIVPFFIIKRMLTTSKRTKLNFNSFLKTFETHMRCLTKRARWETKNNNSYF